MASFKNRSSRRESRERLEVSIFKDLDYNKNLISTVMNPAVANGIGSMMMNLQPVLEDSMDGFSYYGRIRTTTPSQSPFMNTNLMLPEGVNGYHVVLNEGMDAVLMTFKFFLFGGSAYQVHKTNDSSKFSHILPGIHDVDMNCFVDCFSIIQNLEHPFSRSSIDRVRKSSESALEIKDNVLSSVLNEMVSTIRDHIVTVSNREDFVTEYDLFVDGSNHQVVLMAPDHPTGDKTCMYTEVVADYFRIKVVDDMGIMRIQVEVKPHDVQRNISFTDHAFEMIIPLGNPPPGETFERINGVNVETKFILFTNTISALIDRGVNALILDERTSCGKKIQGKCSQDFLRIVYLLLNEMDTKDGGWATKKIPTHHFRSQQGGPILIKMVHRLGAESTPIKIFLFLSSFVGLCVKASMVSYDSLRNLDEPSGNLGEPSEFDKIVVLFRDAFEVNDTFVSREDILSTIEDVKRMISMVEQNHKVLNH